MPQMAPLSWLTLFLFFTAVYVLNTAKVYFASAPKSSIKNSETKILTANLTWKW